MKKAALLAILLSGCATQSGVMPEGKDAYLLILSAGYGFTSSTDLKIRAHEEAAAFCGGQHKRPETIYEKMAEAGVPDRSEESLKFRCVAGGDTQEISAIPSVAH